MKRTNKYNTIFLVMTILVAGTFLFSANSASASQYCANGTTMTAPEYWTAQSTGKISYFWTSSATQATIHVLNATGCTAPLSLASYKMFQETGTPGWLTTQQFIADSGVVNINANGATTLTVPFASCQTQVDLWYPNSPQTLSDSGVYNNIDRLPFNFTAAGYNMGNLCTNPVTPVVVPAQVITQTQSNNQNVYVNTTPATATPASTASQSYTNNTLSVQTNSATNISNNQATLNGYLNNSNTNTYSNTCLTNTWFQWGTTTSYGYETGRLQQNNAGAFNQNISNVYPGNIYHYRAAAQNCQGNIVYGQDMTFNVVPQVLGASSVSTGLTNNFWVDSFILPLILALIGIWMLKSGMFFGLEKWFSGKKQNKREFTAEKELNQRILSIREQEQA